MIDEFKIQEDHEFYKYNLESNHTSLESCSKKDKDVLSGVVKLQDGEARN